MLNKLLTLTFSLTILPTYAMEEDSKEAIEEKPKQSRKNNVEVTYELLRKATISALSTLYSEAKKGDLKSAIALHEFFKAVNEKGKIVSSYYILKQYGLIDTNSFIYPDVKLIAETVTFPNDEQE